MMDNWIKGIEEITNQYLLAFRNLDELQLNWKPRESGWSIAQNIEHVILTNESFFPHIEKLKNNTLRLPFIAKIGFLVKLSGKFVLKAVAPNNPKKIDTFPIWQPSKVAITQDVVERFENHQNQLISVRKSCEALIEKEAIIVSPANANIVYPLSVAFDIILEHEKRHFIQAQKLLTMQV